MSHFEEWISILVCMIIITNAVGFYDVDPSIRQSCTCQRNGSETKQHTFWNYVDVYFNRKSIVFLRVMHLWIFYFGHSLCNSLPMQLIWNHTPEFTKVCRCKSILWNNRKLWFIGFISMLYVPPKNLELCQDTKLQQYFVVSNILTT